MENKNFWKKGKEEQRKFYDLKISTKTNLLGTVFGLLSSVVLILPYALILFQFIYIYGYNRKIIFVYLLFIFMGIMIFNGILNYLTIKFSKSLEKENQDLQNLAEKYVFYYQALNPVFAGLSLILIFFFAYQITGGF